MKEKSQEEHKYTSTGIKFWSHEEQMNSYKKGSGRTIISTHISPTSKCNLNCGYCSVKKRNKTFEIEPKVIKDYVNKLKTRGLKAVIFTGGGEPTIYPQFNEIASYVHNKGLETALITNGTLIDKVMSEIWDQFSWVRISINQFQNWQKRISSPKHLMNSDSVLGTSFVYTGQSIDELKEVGDLAERLGAEYIRVLPDCLPDQEDLLRAHKEIEEKLGELNNSLFFHQFKIHGAPDYNFCHQSAFRPYLSEVDGGAVYPCDSIVLNDMHENFERKYQLCKAGEILDFFDGKIKQPFDAIQDCQGCVFTDNVNMLGDWKEQGKIPENLKKIDSKLIKHVNFP